MSSMPPRYFLRCLGSPELRGPTGEPIRIRTRKHLALLLYLAVEPRQAHRRDRLADLLWPGAKLSEGRHSLATALSVIRGKLGPNSYEATRDTVKLVAPELEIDLDRLIGGTVLGDEFTPPLEMGGFLDDFDIPGAPDFMLWCDQKRAHYFPNIRIGFSQLMDRRRRTGAFAQIETLADRLLELDPLSEEAIRAKMEGRAFAGDRISAIRIFQDWKQRLITDLGAVPSELLEGMALRLRQRGYEAPGTSHVPTVSTEVWRNRAFVGREHEYRSLYERWEQTREGAGRHVLVMGDSGLGKTTLVERLTTATGLEGSVTARVQCYELDRQVPYSSIGTLVRSMLERPGASATSPEWLAELAKSIPAVAIRFPDLPQARDIEGEASRIRLTEAVHQLASAIADEHPLVLFVDDLHLADDASVAVLHLLMRRTQQQQIMLIATARQLELSRAPNASRLLESRNALALEVIHVPALTDIEIALQLAGLAGALDVTLQPAIRHALTRSSAGVPMVAELLFDDWNKHRDECIALSVGAMTREAASRDNEVMDQIIDRIFNELSPPAKAVLDLAAILGDRLNDLKMYELVDLSLAQTLTGMSELTKARILRDGGAELEFRNELLRGRAYLNVPSPLRRALHGLILDRLLRENGPENIVAGLTLAWHCYRAGQEEQAHPHLLRGSREALARGAPFEAELALQSVIPRLSGGVREDAVLLYTQALQEQGRWKDSIEALNRYGSESTELEGQRIALEIHAKSKVTYAIAECQALFDRAIVQFDLTQGKPSNRILVEACTYLVHYFGDATHGERLLQVLRQVDLTRCDLLTRLSIVPAIAHTIWSTKSLFRNLSIQEELSHLSEECDRSGIANSSRFYLENVRGCVYTSRANYEHGLVAFQKAFATANTFGDDDRAAVAASNIGMCYGRLGKYAQLAEWSAIGLSRATLASWRRYRAHFGLAWSHAMLGKHSEAVVEAERMLASVIESPSSIRRVVSLLAADVLQSCGQPKRALEMALFAIEGTDLASIGFGHAGPMARWIAIARDQEVICESADLALNALAADLNSLDLLDQAEVLTAQVWLCERRGIAVDADLATKWRTSLNPLPLTAAIELRRLGFTA